MSYLRFNHVFFGLLALAFVSAFVLPSSIKITQRIQAHAQGIFTPISWPVDHITGWAKDKLIPQRLRDDGAKTGVRSDGQLLLENGQLRQEVASLTGEVQRLRELEAERAQLGENIRDLVTHFSVAGADSGLRESLLLSSSGFNGLREGMPVLYRDGIAGRISSVGVGGARVELVTDRGCRFTAAFARFVTGANGAPEFHVLPLPTHLVVGMGNGILAMQNVKQQDIAEQGIRVGDWLVLDDPDWSRKLKNYKVGRIDAISPSRNPGFADIQVVPDQTLTELRDVMVLNKEK